MATMNIPKVTKLNTWKWLIFYIHFHLNLKKKKKAENTVGKPENKTLENKTVGGRDPITWIITISQDLH